MKPAVTFTRSRQRDYRNRLNDAGLVCLVLAIAEGPCPPEILRDWLADHPMHTHDLSRLLWNATTEYVERDTMKALRDIRPALRRWELRSAMDALEQDVWRPVLNGLANSCIRSACRRELNIDHMGRSLDVTGRLAGFNGDSVSAGTVAMQEDQR